MVNNQLLFTCLPFVGAEFSRQHQANSNMGVFCYKISLHKSARLGFIKAAEGKQQWRFSF